MAILGVLLGITMCAVAWAINESISHKKLIIQLQSEVIFNLGQRVTVLEKRKAVISEAVAGQPKPAGVLRRTWNEDSESAE